MISIIELDKSASDDEYETIADLGNASYTLRLCWSRYGKFWSLDMLTSDGEALLLGQTVIMFQDLLEGVAKSSKPPGRLFFANMTGSTELPNKQTLGNMCWLYYDDLTG